VNLATAAWAGRLLWIALPLSLGSAIDGATSEWPGATRTGVVVFVSGAWVLGVIALFAPRPRSFTVLRVVAPFAMLAAIGSLRVESTRMAWSALAHAATVVFFVLGGEVADRCADGASYGNERRHPLRLPPQFALFFVPVAVAVAIVGSILGPWQLADRHWGSGAIATALGVPAAAFALRALVSLERRFVVFVPAGFVISDSIVLVDPVLFPREHVVRLAMIDDRSAGLPDARAGVLDLRLATPGAVELVVDEPAPIPCRRGRAASRTVDADRVLFAPLRPSFVVDEWQRRSRTSRST
jgi:hypothetical protein